MRTGGEILEGYKVTKKFYVNKYKFRIIFEWK